MEQLAQLFVNPFSATLLLVHDLCDATKSASKNQLVYGQSNSTQYTNGHTTIER